MLSGGLWGVGSSVKINTEDKQKSAAQNSVLPVFCSTKEPLAVACEEPMQEEEDGTWTLGVHLIRPGDEGECFCQKS